MERSLRVVVFDFDGVILDSKTIWDTALQSVVAERYGHCPLEIVQETGGYLFSDRLTACTDKLGIPSSDVDIAALEERAHVFLTEGFSDNPVLVKGVDRFMKECFDAGLSIGVVSSGYRRYVVETLKRFSLDQFVSYICAAEDVERHKPDPTPYLIALNHFSVEASQAVVFEDSLVGIQAAHAAKIKVIGIQARHGTEEMKKAGASIVYQDFSTLTLGGLIT